MAKKIGFIVLVSASLLCGIWGYLYLQDLKKPALRPLDVLPDSCSMLIEVKEPKSFIAQLTQGNLLWEELIHIRSVQHFHATMSLLDSLTQNEETREYFGNEPFYIAVYGGGNTQQVLYAFNLSDVNESDRALAFFEKHFSARRLSAGLYQCTFSDEGKADFFLHTAGGLLLAAKDRVFLEQVAARKSQAMLSGNENFAAAYKVVARDQSAGLFLHFPYFSRHNWRQFFSEEPAPYFSDTTEKWIPADIGLRPSELTLQGFLPPDSAAVARVMQHQDPVEVKDVLEHLPYATVSFELVSVSNYAVFCRGSYLGDADARKRDMKMYSDSLAADAQTEIIGFLGGYLARCSAATGDSTMQYGLVAIADEEAATRFLRVVADSVLRRADSLQVFYFRDKALFTRISGRFLKNEFAYGALISECLVFSNRLQGLEEYMRAIREKNLLPGNERATNFLADNFNAEVNYLFYSDVHRDQNRIRNALAPGIRGTVPGSLFENFDAIGLSVQRHSRGLLYKAHAGFNPKNKTYQNTLWETLCDTTLVGTPVPVVNHRTGEKELVCQDLKHNLYLLSNTGKILWKHSIGERMLGAPVQVDYFANGKLQLMFASESQIHLLDRNGNYVDGFPVRIKAGAAGELNVFDYDGSKNYRIWLPLKNNTVVCLNAQCKLVEGFAPISVKAPLARPIWHISLQQKDYFILSDTLGHLYAVNRRGESRLSIVNKLPAGRAPVYLDIGKDISKTYLCYADMPSKALRMLSLTDQWQKISWVDAEANGYTFDTMEANTPRLVLFSGKAASWYDLHGRKIQQVSLPAEAGTQGAVMPYGDRKVFAVLSAEGNLLLVDLKTGEPLASDMKLSGLPVSHPIIKNQGNYLIGWDRNKIFCLRP